MAFDGRYVYLMRSSSRHLLKLGTGLQGTVRGMVYASRETEPCQIVWLDAAHKLLMRRVLPSDATEGEGKGGGGGGEGDTVEFCAELDPSTLEVRAGLLRGRGRKRGRGREGGRGRGRGRERERR